MPRSDSFVVDTGRLRGLRPAEIVGSDSTRSKGICPHFYVIFFVLPYLRDSIIFRKIFVTYIRINWESQQTKFVDIVGLVVVAAAAAVVMV
jgi:hypothetical protein